MSQSNFKLSNSDRYFEDNIVENIFSLNNS